MPLAPSGEQFALRHGDQRAVVVEVGGGIRSYVHGERDVLEPYAEQDMCDGGHGSPLIPWPNRLADGKYTFDGKSYQLAITEIARNNATHGLLRWANWRCLEREPSRVRLGVRLHPQPAYPFLLDVSIDYALSDDGLVATTAATNLGSTACPYASGQHPYLSPGTGRIDDAVLHLDAATFVDTDNPRQLPTGSKPVAGSDLDFRVPRRIGETRVDHAYTDLVRTDGLATVRLTGSDRRTVELWADASYPILQIFTGDTLAPHRARHGLACEPMTAPSNALASGQHLIRLEPDETHISRWGVRIS
ncbi:MAG: aldose 1-epimerase family protein [Sporichthyaceae bacterium]